MQSIIEINAARDKIRRFACLVTIALAALPANAEVIPVGGEGTIGTTVLPTVAEGTKQVATVSNDGAIWTAAGGEGIVYSRLISPTLTVPASGAVTLTFNHGYNFEDAWDGGAVYVSVNGAESTYVEPAAFIQNGYDGLLAGPDWVSSVFVGQETFTGKSDGYDLIEMTECVVNLGVLNAGDTISFEFRGGWDDAVVALGVNWEIFTAELRDSANTALLDVDFYDGPGGFTVISDLDPSGSWRYLGIRSEFEINATTKTSDRYAPSSPGPNTIIDLNGVEIDVILLEGTLEVGDTFTLFDLSGGTTLRGSYYSISLPEGSWDVSQLAVTGTITCRAIGGGLRVSTYDTIQGAGFLNPISNLLAMPASGTGIQTEEINYGNFLSLPGITSMDSFTVLWEGWLDVTVDGHGDYTFGTSSDDGSVIMMDLNDDGDFSDPGEIIVNNNRIQPPTVVTGTVTLNMDSVHVLIGFFENQGGEEMIARFKKGSNLAWNSLQPIGGKSGHFSPDPLRPTKEITGFSVDSLGDAQILENQVTIKVPGSVSVTALAPMITINGTTVSPASGVPQDFTQPVVYTVTASDGTTRDYTVTAFVIDLPVTDGLTSWLKADSIQPNDSSQGRIFSDNAFVARWNDVSSNRQRLTQGVADIQPRYLANDINGLPSVKWDGTGQYLRSTTAATIKTIFIVAKKDAERTGLDGIFCASPSLDSQNIRGNATSWRAPGSAANNADFPDLGAVSVNGTASNFHNNEWHILMEESATSPMFAYQLGQTAEGRFFNGRIAEVVTYDRSLAPEESEAVGSYLADKYALDTAYPPLPASEARMYAFGIPGWPGVVNESLKTISMTVPFSTDLTTLAPTYTLSGGAIGDKAFGSIQNFTNPVAYSISSPDNSVTSVYTVTVTKAPVRSDKEMLTFGPDAFISETTVSWTAPYGSDLASLSPTYVVSPLASATPASGTTLNFTNPVVYTVTAEDGSALEYTVTATVGPAPPTTRVPALWLDASQMQGVSEDQVVNLWPDMSGSSNSATLNGGSPVYKAGVLNGKPVIRFGSGSFNFSRRIPNIRSVFWVVRENAGASDPRFLLGDTATYDFHRGAGVNGPIWSNQWSNVNIRNGITRLMGSGVDGTFTSMPADTFQLLSVVTTGDVQANTLSNDRAFANRSWNGDIAEILIYDAPLSSAEEAEIGSHLAAKYGLVTDYPAPAPLANLYSFGLASTSFVVNEATKSISLTVPYDTDVTSLAPTYVISGGATGDKPSGSPQNFTNPVTYTFTSSDSAITNAYTVTVTVAPVPPSPTAPVLWLDASKLTGLSDDQQVDTWRDASGLDNHAIRIGGAPVYKTSIINGQPVVRFDTGNFGFNRISTIRSVFWVLKENVGASQPRFLLGDTGSYDFHRSGDVPNGPIWSSAWASPSILSGMTKLMGTPVNGTTTPLPSETFQVLSLVTTGNVRANTVSLDRNIANRSWNGDIAEILIYDKALSAAEELQVGAYLSTKYGLTTGYADPYSTWASGYPGTDLTDPAADADGDGLSNQEEYAFGLNPTSASSVNPISMPLNKTTGMFSYTRRNPALTSLTYKIWTSPDLVEWTWDQTATQTVAATTGDVQTVNVTLTNPPTAAKLFVRVSAP